MGTLLLSGFLLLFANCNKDPDADFVTREFAVENFHTIDIDGVYAIFLVQDTVCKVTMTASPRVLDKNKATVENGILKLSEKHGGHWLHPRESNTKVYIHVDSLARINVHETSDIRTTNPLTGNEIGMVVDYAKAMDADLELACNTFYYWNDPNGAHLKLRGQVQNLKIWNTGLAAIDAQALQTNYALIDNGAQGTIRVRALQILEYRLSNTGNILYYGTPAQFMQLGNTGTGQLLQGD